MLYPRVNGLLHTKIAHAVISRRGKVLRETKSRASWFVSYKILKRFALFSLNDGKN